MSYKKHVKSVSEIRKKNVQLDMESMERFRNIVEDMKDEDKAIELDFLKDHLRLRPDDLEAMEELKIKMGEIGEIDYKSVVDETDQKVYISFYTPGKEK